jgi:hypothetical protein
MPIAHLPSTSAHSTPQTDTSTANNDGGDRNVNMAEYIDPADRNLQLNPPKVPFFQPGPSGRPPLSEAGTGNAANIGLEPDPSTQLVYRSAADASSKPRHVERRGGSQFGPPVRISAFDFITSWD